MLDGFTMYEMILLTCGVVGSLLVFIRLAISFAGADGHDDGGFEDHGHGDGGDGDSDSSFSVLSVQALSAFFMMFGLVGLSTARTVAGTYSQPVSAVAGVIAGLIAIWTIKSLMRGAAKLYQDGNISIDDAVGAFGTVYTSMTKEHNGAVMVDVKGNRREYVARTGTGADLPTGMKIVVTAVEGDTLVVEGVAK